MRPPFRWLAALLLLSGLAGLLGGCADSTARDELAAFEAAIEDRMGEEAGVAQRLSDLRDEMALQNISGQEYRPYAVGTALPFYRQFAEKVAGLTITGPTLGIVRENLADYLDAQIRHIEAMEEFLTVVDSPEQQRLTALETEWKASMTELIQAWEGQIGDREVAELVGFTQSFLQARYQKFLGGELQATAVENDLRQYLIPRMSRAADAWSGDFKADGKEGARARYARASTNYFELLASTLPAQESLTRAAHRSREAWDAGVTRREKFLESLKEHRESLR